jgi:cytochrome c peroxidase
MHNGMLKTLNEVINFYNAGGGKDINKDRRLKPLKLTAREKADLVKFLLALSGDPLTGKKYVYEFKSGEIAYKTITNWLEVDARKPGTWKFEE